MNDALLQTMVGDLGPVITIIVVVTVSLIAVLRFGVRFDLNEYLKSRKKRQAALAQLDCPHMRFSTVGDELACESLFYSPRGTLDWVCSQCGIVVPNPPSEEERREIAEYYVQNPKEYKRIVRKFEKHAKRSL